MAAPPWRLKFLVAYLHRHGQADTAELGRALDCTPSYVWDLVGQARHSLKDFTITSRTVYELEPKP